VFLSLVAFEDARKKPTGFTESVKNNPVEQSESGAGSSLTEEGTGGNVPARLQTPTANGKVMGRSNKQATDSAHRTRIDFFSNRPRAIRSDCLVDIYLWTMQSIDWVC
jgi:hypothetical protein